MPSIGALNNSIFKFQMLTFNSVVVLNVLGSLHVLPHQLHGDHPQRVHLPHTHSGSVEASFETQLVSEIHIRNNIFEKKSNVGSKVHHDQRPASGNRPHCQQMQETSPAWLQ